MKGAREERDRSKEEGQVARLVSVDVGDVKARVEDDLARAQGALATVEEAKLKAEVETSRLEVERTSLMVEIRMMKDEVCFLHSQVGKDKEVMGEDYQKALEVIFAYDYGCCTFKHNICGDHPEVPDGMPNSSVLLPSELFANAGCPPPPPPPPPHPSATQDTTTEAHMSEAT